MPQDFRKQKTYLRRLNAQIKNVNNHSAGIDEKLSNFLSTQLNTQSSILQLINKINEQGFLDNSTKKIFEDLNLSIQELNAKKNKLGIWQGPFEKPWDYRKKN